VNCVICRSPGGRSWGSYGPTPACGPCHLKWVSQQRAGLDVKPTCLYRLYDSSGALLYVGITSNIARRWKEHRTEHREWWPQVTERRVTWFLERLHAWYAEREAVRVERPLHNHETTGYLAGTLPPPAFTVPTPKPPSNDGWWRDEEALAMYTQAWTAWLTQKRDAERFDEDWAGLL